MRKPHRKPRSKSYSAVVDDALRVIAESHDMDLVHHAGPSATGDSDIII